MTLKEQGPVLVQMELNGPEFRKQREFLLMLRDSFFLRHVADVAGILSQDAEERVDGLINLTDAIADQAHDDHGIDCLLEETDESS
jgi:hypothetical protein